MHALNEGEVKSIHIQVYKKRMFCKLSMNLKLKMFHFRIMIYKDNFNLDAHCRKLLKSFSDTAECT